MTVLIPTKGRPQKLLRCVRSIPASINVAIHATCDSDIHPEVLMRERASISFGPENVVQSFNLLAGRTHGNIVLANDDIEFVYGCFDAAWSALKSDYHMVGLHVENMRCNEDAFALVGREIIKERGFLFDPRFEHFFSDTELGRYTKSRGLFSVCKEARIINHHPSFSGEYDDTHSNGRREKWLRDKATWDQITGKPQNHPCATAQK